MNGTKNQAIKIARQLFWINLLPAVVAAAIFLFSLFFLVTSGFKDNSAWLGISLGPGVVAQFIYHRQMVDVDFVRKNWGWWYSIILNALIIVGYIVSIFVIPSSSWFLIIYPIFFFFNSCAGLQALKTS